MPAITYVNMQRQPPAQEVSCLSPGFVQDPSYDAYGYAKVATRTASSLAGAAAACPVNVQNFFKTIFAMAKTASGLQDLNKQLIICEGSEIKTAEDVNSTLAAYVRHMWTRAVSLLPANWTRPDSDAANVIIVSHKSSWLSLVAQFSLDAATDELYLLSR